MGGRGVEPEILHDWLAARSLARGLPQPVTDHGGFRVDTNSETEITRWVFPSVTPAMKTLARSITAPRHFLKLAGSASELRAAVGEAWAVHPQSYFMESEGTWPDQGMPEGYRIEIHRANGVVAARIESAQGELAASGYAAELPCVFVYDRIVTLDGHRRKGLGRAIMTALHNRRENPEARQLLAATEEGRALYEVLGWRVVSLYSSASVREG